MSASVDWVEFEREFYSVFGRGEAPPAGTFPGANFMADEVMGFYPLAHGFWAEVSTGLFPDLERDLETGRLGNGYVRSIGVTVARPGPDAWDARSEGVQVFRSVADAFAFVERERVS